MTRNAAAGIGIYHCHDVVVQGGAILGNDTIGARVVGGSDVRIERLSKYGTGEVVHAVGTDRLAISDVLQFSDYLGPSTTNALVNDLERNDRAGFLRRVKKLAGKMPIEKFDALMSIAFRIFGS